MLKTHLAACVTATALFAGAAAAQTTPAPAPMATTGSSQVMTEMGGDHMRGSKLVGVDVYGSDNAKIGDIDEIIVDRNGAVQAVVIGVGGFLGIGAKDVAIPFTEVKWTWNPPASASTAPAAPGGVTPPNAPTTTGSTTTSSTMGAGANDDGIPDRAVVAMTRDQLKSAPEFHYRTSAAEPKRTAPLPPLNAPASPATPQ